jgi:putative membrane protein
MLNVVAHAGPSVAPHDLWSAWSVDPLVLIALGAVVITYARGQRRRGRGDAAARQRAWCAAGGIATIGAALLSPLDAASSSLASAHMVQHVVLVLIAAPLLALARPGAAIVRGAPVIVRRTWARWRRPTRSLWSAIGLLAAPVAAWLLHAGALWFWHAAVPYDAAVRIEWIHAAEHTTFLGSAFLFWRAVVPPVGSRRSPDGIGIMLVFAMALQAVFLSALLTFATTPWYDVYAHSTAAWGITRLDDQQLAGAIMWVPAGLIYVAAGLAMLASWIHAAEPTADPRATSVSAIATTDRGR